MSSPSGQFIDICLLLLFSETVLLRIMSILASAGANAHARDTCATYTKYSCADTMHVSRHPGVKDLFTAGHARPIC